MHQPFVLDPKQNKDNFLNAPHYTAWQLIKSYWQSDERVYAYISLAVILIMTVTLVGFEVVFNYWYNYFYNALQKYDVQATVRLLGFFAVLAFFFIVLQVYRYYISQLFGLRWRRWLTKQLIGRWMSNRGYYYLETFDEKTDNPDQRIQEDAALLASNSLDLTVGLVSAVTTFPAFLYILWTLSGVLVIPLGSWGTLHITGYLLWAGLIYNLIGTLLAFKIGWPLVPLNFEQQSREASFRHAAIDLRSHSESVALYRGEDHQKNILYRFFGKVLENYYNIILRQKKLIWFTGGYNQAAVLLPFAVALPNYFNKVFLLGGLMQSIRAFTSVQESLSFLVNSYTQIAQWRAICRRLTTFVNHVYDATEKAEKENKLEFVKHNENSITANAVTIKTPEKDLLLININEKFIHGQNYVIKGVSGIGKSTFVRTLAGIWPFASGKVELPTKERIMYLPQDTYMPMGSLADAILFPDKHKTDAREKLGEILRDCRLEKFISRLDEVAAWSEQMSPGEQQRIAFARILLQQPDWVFLDETTSMLDLDNEKHLYGLLQTKLPHCSIVSVGHRPSLDTFHEHIIDISQYSYQQPLPLS